MSLFFNFVLECAIRRVPVNQDSFKLNGTHQFLVYADVNDKTKYMVMFREQNAGYSRDIKTDNSSFEIVEDFICMGTTLK
jgi:hypothetical protein